WYQEKLNCLRITRHTTRRFPTQSTPFSSLRIFTAHKLINPFITQPSANQNWANFRRFHCGALISSGHIDSIGMPRPSNARDVTPPETQFTQFEARSDDSETLWDVKCILSERGNKYLVNWEGE